MKTFPAGLDTLLATGVYVCADLYDFTLQDGTHLRYTTADTDVISGGNVWTSKGPYFDQLSTKSRAHWKAGLDLDTWQVTIAPAVSDPITGTAFPAKIYNQPWLVAVRVGALDGATVDIHRAYWAAWPTRPFAGPMVPDYVLVDLFAGRVAGIAITRSTAVITINSWVEILARPMPRNLYGAGCRFTLFDSGCQLTRASFAVNGTVSVRSNDGLFTTSLGNPDNYFALGMLTWTSGNNAPLSFAIRSYANAGGTVQLLTPAPYLVQAGDAFTAYPGCDKTQNVCNNTFGNLANFGGFPAIPAPETAQ